MAEAKEDLLWNQFAQHVDLYKFYLEMVLKVNTFHYAITGGIISFILTHPGPNHAKMALLLPLLMSVGFTLLFAYGCKIMPVLRQDMFDLRDKLGLDVAPEFNVLSAVLGLFAITHAITAAGLVVAFAAY